MESIWFTADAVIGTDLLSSVYKNAYAPFFKELRLDQGSKVTG